MNKTELIASVAAQTKLTQAQVGDVVNSVLSHITQSVAEGDTVALIGFGTFKGQKRAAREGKNPQTGAKLLIPEAMVPKFTPGSQFKDAVNSFRK